MWNLIGANRLLDQRVKQQQYRRHKKILSEIKPQIDNLPPQHFQFLITRPKTKQLARELNQTVQVNNCDLVRRMMRPKSSTKSSRKQSSKNSLHSTYFKHMAGQIEEQNKKLVERLRGATACVSFNQLQQEHKRHLQWKANHRKSQQDSEGQRPASAR